MKTYEELRVEDRRRGYKYRHSLKGKTTKQRYLESHKNEIRAIKKRWSDKNKEYLKAKSYEYIKNNPQKYKAHNKVNNSVQKGKLEKQPCFICGNSRADAHHEDYSKPLEVIWLCRSCHVCWHLNIDTHIIAKDLRAEVLKLLKGDV